MSTLLNDDELQLQQAVRSFMDKRVAPLVAEHERARTFPWELLRELYASSATSAAGSRSRRAATG